MSSIKVAVIGGGAAGLMSAAILAINGATVEIFERNNSFGKKLSLTGNGKCNLTNSNLDLSNYKGCDIKYISKVFSKFNNEDLVDFFLDYGFMTYEKNSYIYPRSDQAKSVISFFEKLIDRENVTKRYNSLVKDISFDQKFSICFTDTVNNKDKIIKDFDKVIVCCGGKARPNLGSDGFGFRLARKFEIEVSNTYPVLVPLKINDKLAKSLSGIRTKGNITAVCDGIELGKTYGELQFTDEYISGIPVFELSRLLSQSVEERKKCRIVTDFLPDVEDDYAFLKKRLNKLKDVDFKSFFEGIFNDKLYSFLLKEFKNSEYGLKYKGQNIDIFDSEIKAYDIKDTALPDFLTFVHGFVFEIFGHAGFNVSQCTKGGVILSELTEYCESIKNPGLYFVGEMIDVDGNCGGYNLQWAFSTGYIASMHALNMLGDKID